MAMTPEDQLWFEQLDAMFMTPGWKNVVTYFQEQKDNLQEGIFNYSQEKSFFIAKGRAQILDQIVKFEEFCDTLKEAAKDFVPDA